MIKKCEVCGVEFEARAHNTKFCPQCRDEAHREINRRWKQAHPEHAREAQRRWRQSHGEKKREYDRRYRQTHRQTRPPKPSSPPFSQKSNPNVRTCKKCGEQFAAVGNAKHCPQCLQTQHQQDLLKARERAAKRRQLIKKKVDESQGKPTKTLADWAREAADCNLDYGTYRALIASGKTFEQLKADRRSPQAHSHCRTFHRVV